MVFAWHRLGQVTFTPVWRVAETTPMFNDIISILVSLGEQLEGVMNLVAALSYVAGVMFIAAAVIKIRSATENRSQMFQPMDLGGPLINFLTGVALIWWPVMLDSVTYTFWGTTSPMEYEPSFDSEYQEVWVVILNIMRVVGLIAFVRGWYYLTRIGEQGAQGMLGKGLTHIIGGVLAYHMGATIHVLMTTFGFDWA